MAQRRPSMARRNARRQQLWMSEIPPSLRNRDLAGFRYEYWYSYDPVVNDGISHYFRSRRLALRDAKDRGEGCVVLKRHLVITDGRRGWSIVGMMYVRTHRILAAEREARIARRQRALAAAVPATTGMT